jgi:hypothetical protein
MSDLDQAYVNDGFMDAADAKQPNLDEAIRAVLLGCFNFGFQAFTNYLPDDEVAKDAETGLAEIKQAFIDDGWHKPLDGEGIIGRREAPRDTAYTITGPYEEVIRMMTGQEWYDRYRNEWNAIVATGDVRADSHIEAAKKAAGIK